MATESGPCASIDSLNFDAIRVIASSQEASTKLSPWRISGLVSRSLPYRTLERKYPLMQLSPRFTGAAGSPLVAIILPFFTPTSTPHPTPQKRHGAFPQVMPASAASPPSGSSRHRLPPPAAAKAAAAALAFRNLRLVHSIPLLRSYGAVNYTDRKNRGRRAGRR